MPALHTDSCLGQDMLDPEPVREIAAPLDSRMRELLDYWESRRAGRELPVRQDIRPADIRHLLPHLYLLDVLEGTFRFRLRGTAIEERLGRGFTGLTLEECGFGAYLSAVKASLQSCVDRRAPVLGLGVTRWSRQNDFLHYEVCRLPLAGPDGAVAMLLCGMVFYEAHEIAGQLRVA